ncbi:MAG: hypothetical protein K2Q18_15505 [Bdellovibrionales bacterium]|nr:hypothetical protein [Bdellovibrionales bacterium]
MKKLIRLPLNGLEKFMLAHESEHLSYNSQIVVEFLGKLDPLDFKAIIKKAINEIPWIRSAVSESFLRFNRHVVRPEDINLDLTLTVYDSPISQDELDSFCAKKFDLKNGHCFSFLLSPLENGDRTQLVFNVHHTLCDAAGQFHLLEEFFKLLNHMPIKDEAKKTKTFRYRNLLKIMGKKWFFTQLFSNLKKLKNQRLYKMAGLIDHPEATGRTVSSTLIRLTEKQKSNIREKCKEHQVSATEYITFVAFKAYDVTLCERGDFMTPIMAYVPKTLRPALKIRYSFQNILSTVYIVGKRKEINDLKFLGKIKHLIQSHKMDQAAKFIFGSIMPSTLITPKKLKKIFSDLDKDPESITSSMLVSAGKVPRTYIFPNDWKDINLWARGTMLKSPGIGVIFTGTHDNENITLEFVKELTDLKTINKLRINMLEILNHEDSKEEALVLSEAIGQNFIPLEKSSYTFGDQPTS